MTLPLDQPPGEKKAVELHYRVLHASKREKENTRGLGNFKSHDGSPGSVKKFAPIMRAGKRGGRKE